MVSTQKRAQNELTGVLPRPYPRVLRPERVAPPRCGPWRGPLEAASRITFGGESREQESEVRWRERGRAHLGSDGGAIGSAGGRADVAGGEGEEERRWAR